MATIIGCVNGHFYDADKSRECPYCKKQEEDREKIVQALPGHFQYQIGDDGLGEEKTMAMPVDGEVFLNRGMTPPQPKKKEGIHGISAPDEGVTVGIWTGATGTAYVTGWLVGTKGPVKGRDYRVKHGKNWIGRNYNMDIVISEGEGIAMVNQCAIVYDGKGNQFFILQGNGTTTYLNGELVKVPQQLKLGDEISMGNCTFEFVPFCREGHVWEEETQ